MAPPDPDPASSTSLRRIGGVAIQVQRILARAASLGIRVDGVLVDGDHVAVGSTCRLRFDAEAVALEVAVAGRAPDRILWSRDVQGFVLESDPATPIEPVGFVRGLLLETVSLKPSTIPPSATPPSRGPHGSSGGG
jgi:hypothetical protein